MDFSQHGRVAIEMLQHIECRREADRSVRERQPEGVARTGVP